LSDKFDRSTYLTKVRRPPALVPFEGQKARESDLIDKGGDDRITLGTNKTDDFYNSDVKLQHMRKMDKGIPKIGALTDRGAAFGNMYRDDNDLVPDFYDSAKIASADLK